MLHFEKLHEPLASRWTFFLRLTKGVGLGVLLIALALFIGMLGYHYFEHLAWIDAFVNAAMILSSMGPFQDLATRPGKIFAGFYALFSGLFFMLIIGVVFSPVIHRFFHHMHHRQP